MNARKIIVFCLVSFATWMITTPIVAQYKGSWKRAKQVVTTTASTARTDRNRKAEGVVPAIPIKIGNPRNIAEVYMRTREITVSNGVATASAHVSIADKRRDMSYIWRLRALDDNDQPLAGIVYDHQIFQVEANGQKEVTFRDSIPAPAGTRRIELALYHVRPGSDLSFLNDKQLAHAEVAARAIQLLQD